MAEKREIIRDLMELAFIIAYPTIIISIVLFGLFLFGGIGDIDLFDKANFYGWILAMVTLGLFALKLVETIGKKFFPNAQKNTILASIRPYFHDPEKGIPGLSKIYLFKSWLTTFLIAFGLFGLITIGLINFSADNSAFVSPGLVQEQVTKTSESILATFPASTAEDFLFGLTISLVAGLWYWFSVVKLKSPSLFWGGIIIIAILFAFNWLGYHFERYGRSETKMITVLIFGFIGSLFALLTGSIFWWEGWHIANNLYLKLYELFDPQIITIVAIVVSSISLLSGIAIAIINRKKTEVII